MFPDERRPKIGRIRQVDPTTYKDAPQRAAMFVDVADTHLNPEGYLAIMRGDASAKDKGRHIANLADAPKGTEHDERYNPFDGIYGESGDVVGNEQIEMVRMEVEFSIISLTLDNLKLIRPDAKFTAIMGQDNVTPVGVKITRQARIAVTDYRKNIVLVWSTSDKIIGGAYVLRQAINVEENKVYDFNKDGKVFGVDVKMRCHSDGTTMDPETGMILPNFEEQKFGVALPAA